MPTIPRADDVVDADALRREINAELPPDVDWKAGAIEYVEACFEKAGREQITNYSMTKPIYRLAPGTDGLRGLEEAVQYLNNFANVAWLLKLPTGSRVMDVACGGGWMSHYFTRFGYQTFGFDIAGDFIELAKQRLLEDPYLSISSEAADAMFLTHDIEAAPLPKEHHGSYDAIILESCLHHFYDPISALTHLAACLSETGVIVLIEGENRKGSIRPEYMEVMKEFRTIERPYSRDQLQRILRSSGLPHYEFVGQLNGMFSPRDPIWGDVASRFREREQGMNLAVCARTPAALARVFPNVPTSPERA